MRPRTFILLILVLVLVAAAAVFFFVAGPGRDTLQTLLPGVIPSDQEGQVFTPVAQEPGEPLPTATPEVQYVPVVVALAKLPVGERVRADLIGVENRPESNVAVVAGVTFSDPEQVIGQIVKTEVAEGQEILRPMLALNPSDIASMGSDLSLYVDQGEVAVAFPVDRYSGAAYAMRPGDLVDAFMTLQMVDLDLEFQTELPNTVQRVDDAALQDGTAFLFPPTDDGRLELIPNLNSVALIAPGGGKSPIPRRVTQLTLQQMEVLWVGSWLDPREAMDQEFDADAIHDSQVIPTPEPNTIPDPVDPRTETQPDVVILSMLAQDALALKWALETGINVDLVLRAQGDNSVFTTTSVSLPQIFEQGIMVAPEPSEVGLTPRVDAVPTPGLPPSPP
jgi:Flp pilus assembly protein CpaB